VEEDPPLIVVLGPTGSGKSDLGLRLAENLGGEIVNCDSVQLYRFLDIGTAKTPLHERRGVPHHLIDILDPDQHFTAGDYARVARPLLREIAGRGRVPVVVGGTGFYLRALLEGLSEGPVRDIELRGRLARRSPSALHRLLTRFDPVSARRIHPNDNNKVIRALEVCILSRRPMTDVFETNPIRPLEGFRVYKVGLDPSREALSARLDNRCVHMFQSGLPDEVKRILSLGFSCDSKALMSIGYREALMFVDGVLSYDDAVERICAATRQYAKRQRTWFRREPDVFWIRDFGFTQNSLEDVMQYLNTAGFFANKTRTET